MLNLADPWGTTTVDALGFGIADGFTSGGQMIPGGDPYTAIFGSALSGLSGMGQAGPSMATGAAYGAPVTVGGLSISKPNIPALVGAVAIGAGVAWLLLRR